VAGEPDVRARFERYRSTGDPAVRNALVGDHRWIAHHCARRFARRGEPLDDLVQVAQLGLLKAVERFDPSYGVLFPTFAMPTVLGELRRHFRDHTWPVRVPRRVKELYLELSATVELLGHDLGRPPSIEEIAREMQCTTDEVLEGLEAGTAYRTASLATPGDSVDEEDGASETVTVGTADAELASADSRMSVHDVMRTLPHRDRTVLYLRFFDGCTQSEIARRIGVSQVHVSRIIRSTLGRMRDQLAESV
jgi:RNA polymerase sigma-B factor